MSCLRMESISLLGVPILNLPAGTRTSFIDTPPPRSTLTRFGGTFFSSPADGDPGNMPRPSRSDAAKSNQRGTVVTGVRMTDSSRGVVGDTQLYQGVILSGRLIQLRTLIFDTAPIAMLPNAKLTRGGRAASLNVKRNQDRGRRLVQRPGSATITRHVPKLSLITT